MGINLLILRFFSKSARIHCCRHPSNSCMLIRIFKGKGMDDEYLEASGYIHVSWCRSLSRQI